MTYHGAVGASIPASSFIPKYSKQLHWRSPSIQIVSTLDFPERLHNEYESLLSSQSPWPSHTIWSLLAAGLSLCSLPPPMTYLVTHLNAHSIINTIRSTLSVHPLRLSQHSKFSKHYPQRQNAQMLENLFTTTEYNDPYTWRSHQLGQAIRCKILKREPRRM